MKKLLSILLVISCLFGCSSNSNQIEDDEETRYVTLIENLLGHSSFVTSSSYYDISVEMAKIDDGYRYYVTIDNPRNALYDVEAIAVESGVDYSTEMAANVGIFEDSEYCMIPNQANPDKGYVAGLVISGVSQYSQTILYVYVSFKNEDHSITHSEYFKLDAKYED